MNNIEFLDLPEHMLINICEHLPMKDLKALMQSSSYINNLVCNTKKLMGRLCISWGNINSEFVIAKSTREYKAVKVFLRQANKVHIVSLFQKFAPSLEKVELTTSHIDARIFQRMLNHLAKTNVVKFVKIKSVNLHPHHTFANSEFSKITSLKELILINSDCRFLHHFKNMELKTFTYSNTRVCHKHVDAPKNFLATQPHLENLKLCSAIVPDTFNKDVSKVFSFKLLKLEISLQYMVEMEARNLNLFLQTQDKSLQYLKINVEVGSLQPISTMLKKIQVPHVVLILNSFIFTDEYLISDLACVTHLVLNTNDEVYQVSVLERKVFPNITELTLSATEVSKEQAAALFQFTKLKRINFVNAPLKAVATYPSITEVSFVNENFQHIHLFLKLNRQVTFLKVAGQQNIHDGYLLTILRRYKNIKHMDFSGVTVGHANDFICLESLCWHASALTTLVLPRKIQTQFEMKAFPPTVTVKYA